MIPTMQIGQFGRGGTQREVIQVYTIPADGLDVGATVTDGTLVNVLVTYNNWPAEIIDIGATVTAGTLA